MNGVSGAPESMEVYVGNLEGGVLLVGLHTFEQKIFDHYNHLNIEKLKIFFCATAYTALY
jgi:hypothetical protein